MKSENQNFFKIQNWYLPLGSKTFPTRFVLLRPKAVKALAMGVNGGECCPLKSPEVQQVIADLAPVMAETPGKCFTLVDCCAPTDTERFVQKGGAVCSARSAWFYLAQSQKVAQAAAAGEVQYIAVRPYRNLSRHREFRLFIYEGKLSAMSQYWLSRHYHRLEVDQNKFWTLAKKFVAEILWRLPVKTLVMDIYFTANDEILIMDLNPWGEGTDPKLLNTWERDWTTPAGLVAMEPPIAIGGDVKVSF